MESQDAKAENPQLEWRDLAAELSQSVEGEVHFDSAWRAMYATDASNYRQVPIGVVVPKNKEDVLRAIAACKKFGAPVFSRGAGTSLAGQCCNVAVVLAFSKNLNRVLEINAAERWAIVEAGTICDTVRHATAFRGIRGRRKALVQGHCHHKAVMRMGYDKAVFERLGLDYRLLESGCCGMAAFGYERDKFAISQACGEHALFPAVIEAELSTLIIADGFRCREQMQQSAGRTTFHLAAILQMSLQQASRSAPVEHPHA